MTRKKPMSAEVALAFIIAITVIMLVTICVAQLLAVDARYNIVFGTLLIGIAGSIRPIGILLGSNTPATQVDKHSS